MSKINQKSKKNFGPADIFDDDLTAKLRDACEGLMYISETDAPITLFTAQKDVDIVQQLTNGKKEAVDELSSSAFFEKLTRAREWHGDRERARAKKFLDLQKLIEENLTDVKVYRIGKIRIEIYIVGRDTDGRLIGVSTNAIET